MRGAVLFVIVIFVVPSRPRSCRIATEVPVLLLLFFLLCLLVDSLTSIDPFRIDIDSSAQVVGWTLEVLAAYFATELADASLLVYLDRYGALVVAEEAGECRRESLFLLRRTGFAR